MARSESFPDYFIAASVPAGRHTEMWLSLAGQFWVGHPLQNPVWASCMMGCSSGHRHSIISYFAQNVAIFCLFHLFVLLSSPFEMIITSLKVGIFIRLAKEPPFMHRSA